VLNAFRKLHRHRALLYATISQSLRSRFTGNILGGLWLVLYPLLFLLMYSAVFVYILKVRMPGLGTVEYILVIFSGLVPFLAFSEAFGTGTTSIVANRGLLRNTLFPIELVVARDVIVGHASMGLGMLLVWVSALYARGFYWTHLAVPFIYALQIVLTLGIVWITSTLTVFFRDLQQATPILILFLMLVSPIAYTDEMVPEGMKGLLQLNPLAWLMHLYRGCLLEGTLPVFDLVVLSTFSILVFMLGHRLISRLKALFPDYV
jgi:lipopolysaccharide transport system permease protein